MERDTALKDSHCRYHHECLTELEFLISPTALIEKLRLGGVSKFITVEGSKVETPLLFIANPKSLLSESLRIHPIHFLETLITLCLFF